MNSHLSIFSRETPLALPNDFALQITDQNPLFHDDEMYSLNIQVPLEGNRHVFKNVDARDAEARIIDHEHTPMRIIADGIPFRSGVQVVSEDEEIRDSVSFNIDAQVLSFRQLIGELECRDVEIPAKYHDQLLIGEKIGDVNVKITYETNVQVSFDGKKEDDSVKAVGRKKAEISFQPQALGFSYPGECEVINNKQEAKVLKKKTYSGGIVQNIPKETKSYINVDDPYPMKPYCNARVCYKHYDKDAYGKTSESVVQKDPGNEDENRGPLWVLDAKRPQSGICFYLLFFLDCLFEQLGVQFDNTELMNIGDLRRLCFFTTQCKYDVEVKDGCKDIFSGFATQGFLSQLFSSVNKWLSSRGCGGQFLLETPRDKSVNDIVCYDSLFRIVQIEGGETAYQAAEEHGKIPLHIKVGDETLKGKVQQIVCKSYVGYASYKASIMNMYANKENFPDVSVSEVISSLENQFGIRFLFNYETKTVKAVLLRDVFRDSSSIPFSAKILDMAPVSEKITGIKVGYSVESEKKEQLKNVRYGVKDYDTDYDYIDYPKPNNGEHSTVTDLVYRDILGQINSNQMNVFVDKTTGNKYRVKIDSNFSDTGVFEPRLFEVGAHHSVEIGDCSTINEDYVIELYSDFQPVPMNDVNYRRSLDYTHDTNIFFTLGVQPTAPGLYNGYVIDEVNKEKAHTTMAVFVDEDMEHEFVKQLIRNTFNSPVADFYVTEVLKLKESYDPSGTESGNSPLQDINWGLAIAIMRGGGSDSTTQAYDTNYDGFGNSKWRTVVGEYALTTDSIDPYGNVYDYNGDKEGIGNDERFSLKVRSWVQPEWADAPLVVNDPLVKNRGWLDTFLIEYCHFLLHRKKFRVTALCSVAQLADVPNHWKEWWDIDGKRCLIDKMEYSIDAQTGLSSVIMDVYTI